MITQVDVDIIRSLRSLKSSLSSEKFNILMSDLGVTSDEFESRIFGFEMEHEFLFNLYICNLCKSIIPIEEKFTTSIGEYTCDAIITLKDNKKNYG